ncbi:MAG: cytochrome c oxidase subunit I, partial [Alphaproteobacteria bacterium]|nr:cytochrome c oxidase subunit I [Alphaproteobacteria bacterium]
AGWNMVSTLGSYVSVAGTAVLLVLLYKMFRTKERVGANPWGEGATTLEWTVPSPAPFHTHETPPRT